MVKQLAREYVTTFINNCRNPHIQTTIAENFAEDSETMAGPTQNRVKNPQNPYDRVAQLERAARWYPSTKRGRSESDDEDDVEEGRRRIDDTSFSPEKENDGSAFTGESTPGNSPKSTPKSAKRVRTGVHSKAPAPKPSRRKHKAIPVEDAESDDDEATAPSAKKTAKDGEYVQSDTEEEDVPTPEPRLMALLEDPAMTDDSFFVTLRSAMKLEGPMPSGSLQFIELYMKGYGLYITTQKLLQEGRRLVLDTEINKLNQEYQRQCLALREKEVALREKELDLHEKELDLHEKELDLHEKEVALHEKELDLRQRENVLRANEIQGSRN
ncbi:hypothetical protein DFH08DRAFT_797744 [Mycena albidolilacea]|uniref:Uncharacterized protein n=1 Tax=Mycena albidolilacea TaxID=1033008 RepID=A0AAD7F4W6_9AGAR|nr:hypothetical protein DFH08DRAFT_797744 [Mycena albidolilacea]